MHSYWEKQSFYSSSDILIIGAGLSGLLTALELKRRAPRLHIRIVERSDYPSGASVKNAGFACFGSPSEILDDLQHEDIAVSIARVQERYQGLQKLLSLTGTTPIKYRNEGGWELFTPDEEETYTECLAKLDYLNTHLQEGLGFSPYSPGSLPGSLGWKGFSIRIEGEGALDSGALLNRLIAMAYARNIRFTWNYPVHHIHRQSSSWKVESPGKSLEAAQLVLCTNGFTRSLLPGIDVEPARGQVLLTTPIPGLKAKGTYHLSKGYYYFRVINEQILLGGGRHLDRDGEATDLEGVTFTLQNALEELLRTHLVPQKSFAIAQRWSGIMAFGKGNRKGPLIEEIEDHLYIGVRLGGMGIAMASHLADKLADKILR